MKEGKKWSTCAERDTEYIRRSEGQDRIQGEPKGLGWWHLWHLWHWWHWAVREVKFGEMARQGEATKSGGRVVGEWWERAHGEASKVTTSTWVGVRSCSAGKRRFMDPSVSSHWLLDFGSTFPSQLRDKPSLRSISRTSTSTSTSCPHLPYSIHLSLRLV